MSKPHSKFSALVLICLAVLPACAAVVAPSADAERGRYLVDHVGLCATCHSPRDMNGSLLEGRWLQGAPIAFKPTVPMRWSKAAPGIAGLPQMTDEQAVRFLTTGAQSDDPTPRAPIHSYRMSTEDARAVVAYLRRLPAIAAVPASTH